MGGWAGGGEETAAHKPQHLNPPPLHTCLKLGGGGGALLSPCFIRCSLVRATIRPLSEQKRGGGAKTGNRYFGGEGCECCPHTGVGCHTP